MIARDIIIDAYERMNRLSPGETISDDDLAFGLRRLNLLIDELSAESTLLYREIITSAAQTGHITLGAGSWAAIPAGSQVVRATQDGFVLSPITMEQYAGIYDRTQTGPPTCYAQDGLSTVYFWTVPTGQTIALLTRTGAAEFADLTTDYTTRPGVEAMLGASLAVRCAPSVIGKLTPELVRAERAAKQAVLSHRPSILDYVGYSSAPGRPRILNGF